jgi:hypothetical protein
MLLISIYEENGMPPKRNMKDALAASLNKEQKAVANRFERAEALLSKKPLSQTANHQPGERVIRDSFTLPSSDYELISTIRKRCLKAGVSVTKSEVMRAGLHALQELPNQDLLEVFKGLAKIKTGRPTKAA